MRFAQEADSASRLAHPNLVSVIDYGKTDEGLLFLVMDLVEGRTLAEVIEAEAPLPAERVIAIARQVCDGLAHAHDRDLVHRDFKPENVMVRSDVAGDRIVVLDFGLAISREHDVTEDSPARLTSIGVALGTPVYAAPEQTHGQPVDHRADLFALGVTLYEMLAGKPPFDGGSLEVIEQNAKGAVPSIASRGGVDVPPSLEAVVRRLMARVPADRYDSARDVIAGLETVADSLRSIDTKVAQISLPPPEAPRPPRRRRWLLVAAASVAAASAVLGGALFARGTEPDIATVVPPDPPSNAHLAVRGAAAEASPPVAEVVVLERARIKSPVARTVVRSAITAPPPEAARVSDPAPVSDPIPAPIPAPAVVELAAARPVPEVAPQAPVRPAPAPFTTRARADFRSLAVRGSLSTDVIRRALDRLEPRLRACFATAAAAARRSRPTIVRLRFTIEDTRQASSVQAEAADWPALASCVGEVARGVRTSTPPDVGTVPVSVDVAFTPDGPA